MKEPRFNVAWIGLGVMGSPMACRLLEAGHRLIVHNRSRPAMERCAERGAATADSPAAAAAEADVVFIMVPDTPDVVGVATGSGGVLEGARPGTIVVDMSTISPRRTRDLAEEAAARSLQWIDAPVSGGDVGAREGTLTIMAGGDPEAFRRVLPLLRILGRRVEHVGPSGSGQRMKLCNNVVVALNLEAMCEGLALAVRSGLDPEQTLEILSSGAAGSWILSNLGPRVLRGDMAPGFKIRLHQKDLRLAVEEAGRLGFSLPGAELVSEHFAEAVRRGHQDDGTQALIRIFEPD